MTKKVEGKELQDMKKQLCEKCNPCHHYGILLGLRDGIYNLYGRDKEGSTVCKDSISRIKLKGRHYDLLNKKSVLKHVDNFKYLGENPDTCRYHVEMIVADSQ